MSEELYVGVRTAHKPGGAIAVMEHPTMERDNGELATDGCPSSATPGGESLFAPITSCHVRQDARVPRAEQPAAGTRRDRARAGDKACQVGSQKVRAHASQGAAHGTHT